MKKCLPVSEPRVCLGVVQLVWDFLQNFRYAQHGMVDCNVKKVVVVNVMILHLIMPRFDLFTRHMLQNRLMGRLKFHLKDATKVIIDANDQILESVHFVVKEVNTWYWRCRQISRDLIVTGCAIWDIRPKRLLSLNLVKSRLAINYFAVTKSIGNFVESTVSPPCSVQYFTTIGLLKRVF